MATCKQIIQYTHDSLAWTPVVLQAHGCRVQTRPDVGRITLASAAIQHCIALLLFTADSSSVQDQPISSAVQVL